MFLSKDAEVLQVKVFNYQATHGHEVSAPGWLRQFKGYRGEKTLRPGKEIDSISRATISVNAIKQDIENPNKTFKKP